MIYLQYKIKPNTCHYRNRDSERLRWHPVLECGPSVHRSTCKEGRKEERGLLAFYAHWTIQHLHVISSYVSKLSLFFLSLSLPI